MRRGLGYVGAWPLARLTKSHRGYRPVGEAACGRTSREGLLLGRLGGVFGALCASLPPADGALGNSEGENGCATRQAWPSPGCAARTVGLTAPDPVTRELFCPVTRAVGRPRRTIVTWLILPVVICLSQRLSHACLSISNLYSETANGSLNQLSFI